MCKPDSYLLKLVQHGRFTDQVVNILIILIVSSGLVRAAMLDLAIIRNKSLPLIPPSLTIDVINWQLATLPNTTMDRQVSGQ